MRLDDVRRAVVLGIGVSGAAAADVLADRGVAVRAAHILDTGQVPSRGVNDAASVLSEQGVQVSVGDVPEGLFGGADLVVISPGIPPSSEVVGLAQRSGVPIVSEIELGWMLGEREVIAVTGTNGKTTTTSLIGHILRTSGVPSVVAGNIGDPFSRAVRDHPEETVFVCEVSSAQLYFIDQFRPRVGVVLNIAEDHYDWHGSHEAYVQAKANITANQNGEDLLVVRAGDEGCTAVAAGSKARIAGFGLDGPEVVRADLENGIGRALETAGGSSDDALVIVGPEPAGKIDVADIRLTGRHNLENVLAASIASIAIGVTVATIAEATRTFVGLPHRMALVGEKDGVRYIDDSKATNPHAALRALEGLEQVVLIAGGRSKELDLGVLASAKDRLAAVVAIGEAADELAAVFDGEVDFHRAGSIEEAVTTAASVARQGSTVLLSPACSSWDQFASYAERGERFRAAVEAL